MTIAHQWYGTDHAAFLSRNGRLKMISGLTVPNYAGMYSCCGSMPWLLTSVHPHDCSPQAILQPMCFHIFPQYRLSTILPSTTDSYARRTMTHEPPQQPVLTTDDFLALIERHLPELWQAHAHSGNRALRVVLRSAEALLAERAGMDVATFRHSRPDHQRKP